MKFKVKGLVFVGFAAAILSANAYAEGENTVTSKAYTDATYQAKTAANNIGKVLQMASNTAGDIGYLGIDNEPTANSDNLVTSGAVAAAITTSQSATTYTAGSDININDNEITTKYNAGSNVTFTAGTGDDAGKIFIGAHDTTVAAGAANGQIAVTRDDTTTQVSVTGLDNAAYKDVTTDGTLADAAASTGDNSADYAKLPTAGAVKAYVDSKSAVSNFVSQTITDTVTNKAPSEDAVHDALALKQNADVAVKVGTAGTAVGSTTQPVYIDNTGTAQATSLGTAANANVSTGAPASDNGNLVTGTQVYNYVNSLNNNQAFPAYPTATGTTCDADHPCALVSDGTNINWVRMAQ